MLTERDQLRQKLEEDTAKFLACGGVVDQRLITDWKEKVELSISERQIINGKYYAHGV